MSLISKNQSHLMVFVKHEYVRQTLAHPITFSSSTITSCFTFTSYSSSDAAPLAELSYKMCHYSKVHLSKDKHSTLCARLNLLEAGECMDRRSGEVFPLSYM